MRAMIVLPAALLLVAIPAAAMEPLTFTRELVPGEWFAYKLELRASQRSIDHVFFIDGPGGIASVILDAQNGLLSGSFGTGSAGAHDLSVAVRTMGIDERRTVDAPWLLGGQLEGSVSVECEWVCEEGTYYVVGYAVGNAHGSLSFSADAGSIVDERSGVGTFHFDVPDFADQQTSSAPLDARTSLLPTTIQPRQTVRVEIKNSLLGIMEPQAFEGATEGPTGALVCPCLHKALDSPAGPYAFHLGGTGEFLALHGADITLPS